MDTSQKTVTKKKKTRVFETYISKVLKQVSPNNGITSNSKQQLNSVLCIISRLIVNKIAYLTEIAKKRTISEKEVKNALLIVLPTQLAKNAVTEGLKAINTFENENNIKGISRQEKAGIIFPPAQLEKFLRNFSYSKFMVTSNAPVFLAGAIEYLTSEIIKNAANFANDNKRVRITIRDLEVGVRTDDEMNILFTSNRITFLGGGVIPYIHPSLLIKKNRKKLAKKVQVNDVDKKKHRFRPGTVALREIRRFQKMSNCLTFAKFPFEKFVRNIVSIHHKGEKDINMKISKDVFIVLQYFIEQQLIVLLQNANFAAIHAGRVKLMPIDIELVYAIATNTLNPYKKSSNYKTTEVINKIIVSEDIKKEFEEDVEEDVEEEEEEIEEEDVEEEENIEDIEEEE